MALSMLKMDTLDLADQRVLIREDFNVPLSNGKITDSTRIDRALPTVKMALDQGAHVILMSHLGRPTEGEYNAEFSLAPVAKALTEKLGVDVALISDWQTQPIDFTQHNIVLLENVRFLKGEKANDDALAKQMAALCDVFVMDAFATAHRAQASTCGVAEFAPTACAGPLLVQELDALEKALKNPQHPVVAIVGGSKVSSKFQLLDHLLDQVDHLIVGGGIANTFLAAAGHPVGDSLYEPDWVDEAKRLLDKNDNSGDIPLPNDVVVGTELSNDASASEKNVDDVADSDKIFDIGQQTVTDYATIIANAGTIIWNGPVGVFECKPFASGTQALGEAIANSPAFSLAGGGDTVAALNQFHLMEKVSYVSTGGDAFLEYLQGDTLPAVAMLEKRFKH